nr:immunoglobulin light chain junction region [Macaca mulatta]MOV95618.1 immunoglobulin light chain junction region [Macaca mulatta]MOV95795.1 immunoglobulin light chain junction region [Macaca mulatta]MOV96447.1 immunoglobulin light chain junction region [Macaca mulatta]MOV99084.1 immunoglobulin light chain junction region [Macaca mulatta]
DYYCQVWHFTSDHPFF